MLKAISYDEVISDEGYKISMKRGYFSYIENDYAIWILERTLKNSPYTLSKW